MTSVKKLARDIKALSQDSQQSIMSKLNLLFEEDRLKNINVKIEGLSEAEQRELVKDLNKGGKGGKGKKRKKKGGRK